jgi:hypothetical protein
MSVSASHCFKLYETLHDLNPNEVRLNSADLGGRLLASFLPRKRDDPSFKRSETAIWCIQNGAPVVYENKDVLHRIVEALSKRHLSLAEFPPGFFEALKEAGSDINCKDEHNKTPLDYVIELLTDNDKAQMISRVWLAGFKISAVYLDKLKYVLMEKDRALYYSIIGRLPPFTLAPPNQGGK